MSDVRPREGDTRVRFFHDAREFFPWKVSLVPSVVGTHTERQLWLLRLHPRAYELQTPLSKCVWLIAVFTTSADRLESNGWARVCSRD